VLVFVIMIDGLQLAGSVVMRADETVVWRLKHENVKQWERNETQNKEFWRVAWSKQGNDTS
jgi:hypothetical protein